MTAEYSQDYLLDKKIHILQPLNGYRASSDAVLLSSMLSPQMQNKTILDVGSGTGAVSLCLAWRYKQQNTEIFGVEIQSDLAELSALSAQKNNFSGLKYLNGDIFNKDIQKLLKPCSFDAVVTNPPYSKNDMPSPNNSKATAHNLLCGNLEKWLNICLKMAKPFGYLYMINRAEALPHICSALDGKAGGIVVLPIYSKIGQPAKRIIIKAQKDSKAPCHILPPLVIHNENGEYSDASHKILREGCCISEIMQI